MSEPIRHESGLLVESRGHVRVLTLDRPERRNALSSALQADLIEALLDAAESTDVRAAVPFGCSPRLDVRALVPAPQGALVIGECDTPREDTQMLWLIGP